MLINIKNREYYINALIATELITCSGVNTYLDDSIYNIKDTAISLNGLLILK